MTGNFKHTKNVGLAEMEALKLEWSVTNDDNHQFGSVLPGNGKSFTVEEKQELAAARLFGVYERMPKVS